MSLSTRRGGGSNSTLSCKLATSLLHFTDNSETPIKLLDCRVNPQINSLPTYTSSHPTSTVTAGTCSFHSSQARQTTPIASARQVDDPLVSSAPGSGSRFERGEPTRGRSRDTSAPAHGTDEDTLLERNIVYDRLMSGQETETGELPPSYGEAVANAIRSASRSQSRSHSRHGSVVDLSAAGVREVSGGRGREREGRERQGRSRSRLRDLEVGLTG